MSDLEGLSERKLEHVLKGVAIKKVIGSIDLQISAVVIDSRKSCNNGFFVALHGSNVDGHDYITPAINLGCSVVTCENLPATLIDNVTYVVVENTTTALGIIASNFYDNPSSKLKLIAVTGTNGKTSTAILLSELFENLEYKVGVISTIFVKLGDSQILPSSLTTPDILSINKFLNSMVSIGCEYCFMEASSHAINQDRIFGLEFAGAIFTNITHDHIDYHKTFDNYIKSKKKLFDNLPESAFALVNTDDKHWGVMLQNTKATKYTFSLKNKALFRTKIISNTINGLELLIDNNKVSFQLIGEFNAYNLLAAYSVACITGENPENVLIALSKSNPIEGRFQYICESSGFYAIVDYAHTPDALLNVLKTILKVKNKNGRVITVIGCGGNRDSLKRPVMAKVACQYSDVVIITTDNPRYEDPEKIVCDMKDGLNEIDNRKVLCILDRAMAICKACDLANTNDIVLIAGKGHEKYQEIRGERNYFCDFEILKSHINKYIK